MGRYAQNLVKNVLMRTGRNSELSKGTGDIKILANVLVCEPCTNCDSSLLASYNELPQVHEKDKNIFS